MKLYEEKLNQVLEKAQKLAEEASCELIVFMDDSLKKNENGIVLLRQKISIMIYTRKFVKRII